MKALVCNSRSEGRLATIDIAAPRAGRRGVVVQVHASSLNPHDWQYYGWFRNSLYRWPLPLPALRLGHDFSGTVIDTGRGARSFRIGDEVYGMSALPGAFAEQIAIDERMIDLKPAGLSHAQAAALPMVALTSLQALRIGRIRADSKVLIFGGSGGVGSVAVQIAKARGAQVTAVCSGRNVEFVTELGADTVIDYQQADVHDCGERFDIIFDTIGQQSTATCRGLLKPSACFISTATTPKNIAASIGTRGLALVKPDAIRSGTLLALPRARDLRDIRGLVEAGKLHIHLDRQFALEDMSQAIACSQQGRTRGKISIAVDGR